MVTLVSRIAQRHMHVLQRSRRAREWVVANLQSEHEVQLAEECERNGEIFTNEPDVAAVPAQTLEEEDPKMRKGGQPLSLQEEQDEVSAMKRAGFEPRDPKSFDSFDV
jgi:hypothetical protein